MHLGRKGLKALADVSPDCLEQGNCAENTAKKSQISREEQDNFAISSYSRSKAAHQAGVLAKEIVTVSIPQRGEDHQRQTP